MRKHSISRRLLAGVAITATLLAAACSKGDTPPERHAVTVGPDGGEFKLGDLTVTVPEGAVAQETELAATASEVLDRTEAPLGAHTVQFDISLEDDVQPAEDKPLEVVIPLEGLLPADAKPEDTVLYTATSDGGFSLLYSEVRDGAIYGTLPQLSPKFLAFFTVPDFGWLTSIWGDGEQEEECATTQEHPDLGEVTVETENNDGRVEACLQSGDEPTLRIRNKVNYGWSVRTDQLAMQWQPSSLDSEATRFVGAALLPEPDVDVYLLPDDEVWASLPPESLPADAELLTSNSALLAEAMWVTLKAIIGMMAGRSGDEVFRVAKLLINDFADVETCLSAALDSRDGDLAAFVSGLFDIVFSTCGEVIGAALIRILNESVITTAQFVNVFNRFLRAGSALWDGAQLAYDAVIAGVETVSGDVTVRVRVPNLCPSQEEFEDVVARWIEAGSEGAPAYYRPNVPFKLGHDIVCQDGWAYSTTRFYDPEGIPGGDHYTDGANTVLEWVDGAWRVHFMGGTGREPAEHAPWCDGLPPLVLDQLCL